MKAGAIDGLSIGYRTVQGRIDPKTRVRRLHQVDLWEISIVTFPLLAGARVRAVKAASSSRPQPSPARTRAEPDKPLLGATAIMRRRDDIPGLGKQLLEGGGGGSGRSGYGSSPPSYSTGGGTIYTTPRGESVVAPKGYVPSEARNKKGLVLSPKGQDPNNNANIIRYGEPRSILQ